MTNFCIYIKLALLLTRLYIFTYDIHAISINFSAIDYTSISDVVKTIN